MATSRASPALASQAEKASISMGAVEQPVASNCKDQRESAINRASIMASKQRRAERRCVR